MHAHADYADRLWIHCAAVLLLLCSGWALAAGQYDPGYGGPAGRYHTWAPISQVATATAGRLYVVHSLPRAEADCCYGYTSVGRLLSDGTLDTTFGEPDGDARTGYAGLPTGFGTDAVVVRSNGGLLLAGWKDPVGPGIGFVAALDAAGNPDPGFNGGAYIALNSDATAIVEQPDGRFVLARSGAELSDANGNLICTQGWKLQRLAADGTIDATFGGDGVVMESELGGSTLLCSLPHLSTDVLGRLIVQTDAGLRRLTADGSPDANYAGGGSLAIDIQQLTLREDGSLLAADTTIDGCSRFALYDADGVAIASFGSGGARTLCLGALATGDAMFRDIEIARLVTSSNGTRYYVSVRSYSSAQDRSLSIVARLMPDGALDTTFGTGGIAVLSNYAGDAALGLALQSSGALLVASRRDGLFRLHAGAEPSPGIVDSPSNGQATLVSEAAGSVRIRLARTAGGDLPATVYWSTADGSARAGEDYTASSGRIDWAAGDVAEREIVVPIIDDSVRRTDSIDFIVQVSADAGGALVLAQAQRVMITDNDDRSPGGGGGSGGGSGGGRTGGVELLALLALALLRRRRPRPAAS